MTEQLIATHQGKRVGTLHYAQDVLSFRYEESWRQHPAAFPISLSMPLTAAEYGDKPVRAFIEGLLPDNHAVLEAWGKRFKVSARNPFRLLSHVGEECAGGIQFLTPAKWQHFSHEPKQEVSWLSTAELEERIAELVDDHSKARKDNDQGHFSLAGAQPKTALFYDKTTQRWGVPYGQTPTTHILKPSTGDFREYDLNEHFCLLLAQQCGLRTAKSEIAQIGAIPTIIVERFDRVFLNGAPFRIHQEDLCQALSYRPVYKYQSEGGPTPQQIFECIRNHSSQPGEDAQLFLRALMFNWVIGGTDAHAKNYSFLIAGNGQARLAPLYDISSCLPYPKDILPQKARLAMKVHSEYKLSKINQHHWTTAANSWGVSKTTMLTELQWMINLIKQHTPAVTSNLVDALQPKTSHILEPFSKAILERCESVVSSQ